MLRFFFIFFFMRVSIQHKFLFKDMSFFLVISLGTFFFSSFHSDSRASEKIESETIFM
jgi:hypothetical protein